MTITMTKGIKEGAFRSTRLRFKKREIMTETMTIDSLLRIQWNTVAGDSGDGGYAGASCQDSET